MLALGGGVLAWLSTGYALQRGEFAIGLSVKEYCVVRAIVDTMLPGGAGQKPGLELAVPQDIDEEIWAADAGLASDLSSVLMLIEHVPPLYGHFGRFTRLPRETRAQVLAAMLRSSRTVLVQAAVAVKELCQIFYYAKDATWPAIGYDGPWIKTPRPPDSDIAYQKLLAERKRSAA